MPCRANYLHRTVEEFLRSDDVSIEMYNMHLSSLKLLENLTAACLYVLKVPDHPCITIDYLFQSFKGSLSCYRMTLPHDRKRLNSYILAQDEIMKMYKQSHTYGMSHFFSGGHWTLGVPGLREMLTQPAGNAKFFSSRHNLYRLERSAIHLGLPALLGFTEYLVEFCQENLEGVAALIYCLMNMQPPLELEPQPLESLLYLPFADCVETFFSLLDRLRAYRNAATQWSIFETVQCYIPKLALRQVFLACCVTTAHKPDWIIEKMRHEWLDEMTNKLENNPGLRVQHLAFQLTQLQAPPTRSERPNIAHKAKSTRELRSPIFSSTQRRTSVMHSRADEDTDRTAPKSNRMQLRREQKHNYRRRQILKQDYIRE
jgi:hypothetical protein